MKWKLPPKVKIYEALGCLGDGRIKISGNGGEVISSDGSKKYIVKYDEKKNAIVSNDNASYWVGYIGYPSIAFLMLKGIIKYNRKIANALKGIPWREINKKFKNNYEKTIAYVEDIVKEKCDLNKLRQEVDKIYEQLKKLKLNKLPRIKPP